MASITYSYETLPSSRHIRLIQFAPTDLDGSVHCSIETVALEDTQDYACLSYAWGDPSPTDSVVIDGRQIPVAANLASAIEKIRLMRLTTRWWIDAISINQSDLQERSMQVGIMRDIFRKSQVVVVWLGEATDDSDRAMTFLLELSNNRHDVRDDLNSMWYDYSYERPITLLPDSPATLQDIEPIAVFDDRAKGQCSDIDSDDGSQRQSHLSFTTPLYDIGGSSSQPESWGWRWAAPEYLGQWEALDNLLARPWWSRIWVVQEIWHSSRAVLMCGDTILSWNTFARAMNFYEGFDDIGENLKGSSRAPLWPDLKRRYGLAIHISKKRLYRSSLSSILWNTWDREASDPRDKIFAVLGLVNEELLPRRTLEVDYSLTLTHLLCQTARVIIDHEQQLDILLAANGLARRDGLPSWVPDWRKEADDSKPNIFVNRNRVTRYYDMSLAQDVAIVDGHGYMASGAAKPTYAFDEDLTFLTVTAINVGRVNEIGPVVAPNDSIERIVQDAMSTAIRGQKSRNSQATTSAAYEDTFRRQIKTTLLAGWQSAVNCWTGGLYPRWNEDGVLKNVMAGRRFFVSEAFNMGIGPGALQDKDELYIVAGCNYPMVLRPEGGNYLVVGEAYVDGMMNGEGVDDTWHSITLC